MKKLDVTIQELIGDKKIKTKWSELECHGASEFIYQLFHEHADYGSIAQSIIVENGVVCINLFEGLPYKREGAVETLIRMFIDGDDNILFMSRTGSLFMYETEGVDAADLRHYYGKD